MGFQVGIELTRNQTSNSAEIFVQLLRSRELQSGDPVERVIASEAREEQHLEDLADGTGDQEFPSRGIFRAPAHIPARSKAGLGMKASSTRISIHTSKPGGGASRRAVSHTGLLDYRLSAETGQIAGQFSQSRAQARLRWRLQWDSKMAPMAEVPATPGKRYDDRGIGQRSRFRKMPMYPTFQLPGCGPGSLNSAAIKAMTPTRIKCQRVINRTKPRLSISIALRW